MFIATVGEMYSIGGTVDEAIANLEAEHYTSFDTKEDSVYEAIKIKVQRKFEIVKE